MSGGAFAGAAARGIMRCVKTLEPTTWATAAGHLRAGKIMVLPTDTLYGVVGSALQPTVVERIYALRQRDADKPLIVLLADAAELARFGVTPDERTQALLERVWPGPVSVVVPCVDPALGYLHRGTQGLAVRVPARADLRDCLRQTGPLVAPSANPQGQEPAHSIAEAQAYFGDRVDGYVDGGRLDAAASALIDARTDPPRILRPAPGFRLG